MNVQCSHLIKDKTFTFSLQGKKIYKDQCARCFHEPKDQQGLFVCMKCFNGFCSQHRDEHHKDHSHPLYAQYQIIIKKSQQNPQTITKIAIGKQGGVLAGDQYQSSYKLYCNQCKTSDISNQSVVDAQIKSLINIDSPFKKAALISWELQIFPCQHSLILQQAPTNNKNILKCAQCDLSTNLWLCLTCGNTGCGRKNWDGSGGNNHGIEHYNQSKHPLAVKLGTITAEGEASLYCYSCDNDVKDQFLRDHLKVLGLNINEQRKTDKTIMEQNLELNLNFTLSKLVQSAHGDKLIYGKHYTGMNNIGNTCYLNSVIQSFNSIKEYLQVYDNKGSQHIKNCKRIPADCFYCQVSKISIGLANGKYSQRLEKKRIINQIEQTQQYQKGITPYDFKLLIAQGNKQFMSSRQQDAEQYLQFYLDRLDKQQKDYCQGYRTSSLFKFHQTNKLVCMKCDGYKIINTQTNEWKFPVPPPTQADLKAYYLNLENEVDPQKRKCKELEDPDYQVSFKNCLNILKEGDIVDLNCPRCGPSTFTSKHLFKTTPSYIIAVANRFVLQKWVPKKLNAQIQFGTEDFFMNIEDLLLLNSNEGKQLLEGLQVKKKQYAEENLQMIMAMGYTKSGGICALTKNHDNVEAALQWLMNNPTVDFELMLQQEGKAPNTKNIGQQIDAVALTQIMDMGFQQYQAKIALVKQNSNVPAAIEWLFSVGGDVSSFMDLLKQPQVSAGPKAQEAQHKLMKKYELVGVIVHLGRSVHHGHYVSYLKKDKQWTLFNDEKVIMQEKPYLGKGYVYIFKGIE